MPFSNSAYNGKSRYNELDITTSLIEVFHELKRAGLIERAIGFKDRETGKGRISRIWPTEALIRQFEANPFSLFDIADPENRETIILRDYEKEEIDYPDDEDTNNMRAVLKDYNALLKRTHIDIPTLNEPYIDLRKNKYGKPSTLHIGHKAKFVRRVFNCGSFKKGGRFYGGWWQNCPKQWRQQIYINDQPTTEIDFTGFHIVLLYAQEGINYQREVGDDPYQVEQLSFLSSESHARDCSKILLLMSLNAKDERSAFQAFRDNYEGGRMEKRFKDKQLSELLAELKKKHGPIEKYLADDAGIKLMNLNAQISEQIIKGCTDLNIAVLTIHDSFIVPEFHENSLKEFMSEALFEATKTFLGDTHKQLTELTVTKQEDKEGLKSPRYIQRLEKFQVWLRDKQKRE